MQRWPLLILLAGIIFAASVAPAAAPRRSESSPTPAPGPHPLAAGKPDRTGYIKGVYVSYAAMGDAGFNAHIQGLLENTELNAVVLDFKSDRGLLSFPTQVAVAQNIGAGQAPITRDPAAYLAWFQERNIYTIARIVTFKDNLLAGARPDLAIIDSSTGQPWRDQEGMAWVDPFRRETWDYNTALAQEAASLGFDEVQFDYVRFPTDGYTGRATYALPNTAENRTAAITGLLDQTRPAVTALGARLSIDIFGYTAWVPDDLGIGQQIEALAPHVDVLAPMLYPSTFNAGLPGQSAQYRNAIAYPYEIIHQSTLRTLARAQTTNPAIEVRPWLQDFQDYAFDGRRYTPGQIRRQMDGARDAGGRGWLLWDPAVRYTGEALASAHPGYLPNPDGKVLVLAYSRFTRDAAAGGSSPQALRADLEKLLAAGFYPVNLRDLTEGQLRNVPAGKKPVALTFDSATLDQFQLLPDGALDPACAVGVLMAMNAEHPADWPLRATFFVRPDADPAAAAVFGTVDLAPVKLELLASWGLEIGLQPAAAGELTQDQLGAAVSQLAQWHPGYQPVTLSLADRSAAAGAWTPAGEHAGRAYHFTGAVRPAGGLAPAPGAPGFTPYAIPRVPAEELDLWLDRLNQAGAPYVSGGE